MIINWEAIGICFAVGTTLFNGMIFVLMKFNDLKHLDENMKKIIDKVDNLSERISRMEGICSVCAKKLKPIRKR